MDADFQSAVAALVRMLEPTQDAWWIIGSAAVALHGADPGKIEDVDVVISERDAGIIFPRLGLPMQPGSPDPVFASRAFATWNDLALPVEFMAGLSMRHGDDWVAIEPSSRLAVSVGTATAYVPQRDELMEILRLFDRPKDRQRLRAMMALD